MRHIVSILGFCLGFGGLFARFVLDYDTTLVYSCILFGLILIGISGLIPKKDEDS